MTMARKWTHELQATKFVGMLHAMVGDQNGRPGIGRRADPPGFQRQSRQMQGNPQHGEG